MIPNYLILSYGSQFAGLEIFIFLLCGEDHPKMGRKKGSEFK
jgi:hypothetical protein